MIDLLTEQQRAEVEALVRSGKKINAIKIYREATGQGLKESKDAIDAFAMTGTWPRGPVAGHRLPADGSVRDLVLDALRRGNKIEAVRIYREAYGSSLKDAKEAVERMAEDGSEDATHPHVQSRGCLVVVAGLLLVSLAAVLSR